MDATMRTNGIKGDLGDPSGSAKKASCPKFSHAAGNDVKPSDDLMRYVSHLQNGEQRHVYGRR